MSFFLALALALAPLSRTASPADDPPVLEVDGEPVGRQRLEDWLLRERGRVLAQTFARDLVVHRRAREAGVELAPGATREAYEAELQARLAGAFGGRREPWLAELAATERSEEGRRVERMLELEVGLLVGELARRAELSPDVLERELARLAVTPEPALARPGPPDEAVLRVEDAPVARSDYGRWLRLYRGEIEARRFAEADAVRRAAERVGIAVTEDEASARAASDTEAFVESFYGGDWKLWRKRLAGEGKTEDDHLRQARAQAVLAIQLEGLVRARRALGEPELRALFLERYGPEGVALGLRWIRVDAAPRPAADGAGAETPEAARARALALAADLRARALAGQDFALLAERFSQDPSAARGGAPPEGFHPSALAPELFAAVEATPLGGVSAPTLAADAAWIVEVLERRPVRFEDERDALAAELRASPVAPTETAAIRIEIVRDVGVRVLPALFADADAR